MSCPEIGLHINVNKNQDDTELIEITTPSCAFTIKMFYYFGAFLNYNH